MLPQLKELPLVHLYDELLGESVQQTAARPFDLF